MLDGLVDWVTSVVESLGYWGVAALVALENLFPPIPSEVILPLAGFVSVEGEASVVGMVIAATVGSMVGAYALYGIAAAIGPVRLRGLVVRHGKWFGLDESDLDKSEQWFDRRASTAVFVCRCIPLMRSLISIPAGLRRMPLVPFTRLHPVGQSDLEHLAHRRRVPARRAVASGRGAARVLAEGGSRRNRRRHRLVRVASHRAAEVAPSRGLSCSGHGLDLLDPGADAVDPVH